MARKYAINGLPGIAGGVQTHVDGVWYRPGDLLPEGTTSFDLTYWYYPDAGEIAAGATQGKRINLVIEDVPVNADATSIANAIRSQRYSVELSKTFGYPQAVAYSTV